MYALQYTKHAEREIKRLNSPTQSRIYNILPTICDNPYQHVIPLNRPKGAEPLYKLVIGTYRVIMAIRDDKLVILVISAGHRKKVYKRI